MKKTILRICFKPLNWINKWKKKDKNLIFFYSNMGFRDNVKALYDYLVSQGLNQKYKIVVSANDYERYVEDAPQNVSFVGNKQGIKIFMKAKYAFYCFGKYPIKPSKNQVVVNLWHGTPLKKLGNLEKGCEKVDYNFFTKVITNSPMHKEIMAQIFGCDLDQVEIMGNPRCDEMFEQEPLVDRSIREDYEKVIVWMPTYRDYNEDFVVSTLSPNDIRELNHILEDNNVKMIIKLHPLQEIKEGNKEYENIEILTQSEIEKKKLSVYALLRNADGLITDYSSVYFDYLLLDRPIAFAVDDITEYSCERGFLFDNPESLMPGDKIKKFEDVKSFVYNVVNNVDNFKKNRENVNKQVNFHRGYGSSKEIVKRFLGE